MTNQSRLKHLPYVYSANTTKKSLDTQQGGAEERLGRERHLPLRLMARVGPWVPLGRENLTATSCLLITHTASALLPHLSFYKSVSPALPGLV